MKNFVTNLSRWIVFVLATNISFILLMWIVFKLIDFIQFFDMGFWTLIIYFIGTPIALFIFAFLIPGALSLNLLIAPSMRIAKWLYVIMAVLHLLIIGNDYYSMGINPLYFLPIAIPFVIIFGLSFLYIKIQEENR